MFNLRTCALRKFYCLCIVVSPDRLKQRYTKTKYSMLPPDLFEEKFCEFSKQKILVLLQTIFRIVFCRHGMCVYYIGNYTDTPIMHKIHPTAQHLS
jgi:hypothetical protein